MTSPASTAKPKLGFKECQNPHCTAHVYYKHDQCKACGFVQVRVPKGAEPEQQQPAVTWAEETPAIEAAPQVERVEVTQPTNPTQLVPAADPAAPVSYVAMEDFRTQVGDVFVGMKKGRVITDSQLIARLLANNAPIRRSDQVDNLACCPNCKHVFAPERLTLNTGRKGAA